MITLSSAFLEMWWEGAGAGKETQTPHFIKDLGKITESFQPNTFDGFSFKLVRSEGRETLNQATLVGDTCHHPKAKECQNR